MEAPKVWTNSVAPSESRTSPYDIKRCPYGSDEGNYKGWQDTQYPNAPLPSQVKYQKKKERMCHRPEEKTKPEEPFGQL